MRRALGVAAVFFLLPVVPAAQSDPSDPPVHLPGLIAAARITRDTNGIAHIRAHNQHDLFFLRGYVHAQDRLFQMDASLQRSPRSK
jgi:penicillin G amidase